MARRLSSVPAELWSTYRTASSPGNIFNKFCWVSESVNEYHCQVLLGSRRLVTAAGRRNDWLRLRRTTTLWKEKVYLTHRGYTGSPLPDQVSSDFHSSSRHLIFWVAFSLLGNCAKQFTWLVSVTVSINSVLETVWISAFLTWEEWRFRDIRPLDQIHSPLQSICLLKG